MSAAGIETRSAVAELRAAGRTLSGIAAPFDSLASIGTFSERIAKGAFAASLKSGDDIMCLADHDLTRLVGRTRSGTLSLEERSDGLHFSVAVPDTQLGRDLLELAKRGDLGGVSIGFTCPPGGDEWRGDERTLRNINLHEISIIAAVPAYAATTVSARARAFIGATSPAVRRRVLAMMGGR